MTAASAYLEPVFPRDNLDVLVNTQVTKIIKTGTQAGIPVMKGVEFAQASSPSAFFTSRAFRVITCNAIDYCRYYLYCSCHKRSNTFRGSDKDAASMWVPFVIDDEHG